MLQAHFIDRKFRNCCYICWFAEKSRSPLVFFKRTTLIQEFLIFKPLYFQREIFQILSGNSEQNWMYFHWKLLEKHCVHVSAYWPTSFGGYTRIVHTVVVLVIQFFLSQFYQTHDQKAENILSTRTDNRVENKFIFFYLEKKKNFILGDTLKWNYRKKIEKVCPSLFDMTHVSRTENNSANNHHECDQLCFDSVIVIKRSSPKCQLQDEINK